MGNKRGIGARVVRLEDPRFVTGQGRFADDVSVPETTRAYVVRSPHAHARIIAIDAAAARSAPGVLAVLTGDDAVRDGLGGLACHAYPQLPPGAPHLRPVQPILASGKVRHVGDRVAVVVAESLAQAQSAGELVTVHYEPLEAVTLACAPRDGTPRVWDDARSNIAFTLERGNPAAADEQFRKAAHVTSLTVAYPRASANALEPRSAIAYRDSVSGRLTLCTSTQSPFMVRQALAEVLHMPESALRV
ncbi:MAG TPA: molybdopterin cofactor-binding domain-containing protein, partial [Xanthobacteraceae bacterium]